MAATSAHTWQVAACARRSLDRSRAVAQSGRRRCETTPRPSGTSARPRRARRRVRCQSVSRASRRHDFELCTSPQPARPRRPPRAGPGPAAPGADAAARTRGPPRSGRWSRPAGG
jgi:hypothetical protein